MKTPREVIDAAVEGLDLAGAVLVMIKKPDATGAADIGIYAGGSGLSGEDIGNALKVAARMGVEQTDGDHSSVTDPKRTDPTLRERVEQLAQSSLASVPNAVGAVVIVMVPVQEPAPGTIGDAHVSMSVAVDRDRAPTDESIQKVLRDAANRRLWDNTEQPKRFDA